MREAARLVPLAGKRKRLALTDGEKGAGTDGALRIVGEAGKARVRRWASTTEEDHACTSGTKALRSKPNRGRQRRASVAKRSPLHAGLCGAPGAAERETTLVEDSR